MSEKEKEKREENDRYNRDHSVAFWDSKLQKWVVYSDGPDNGEKVAPQTDEIEEV